MRELLIGKKNTRTRNFYRKRTEERLEDGLCVKCGAPNLNGKKSCDSCLAIRNTRAKKLEAEGLCLNCVSKIDTEFKYCSSCLKKLRDNHRDFAHRLKEEVMIYYGGVKCSCPGCKESDITFLTIDHINGKGSRHRREETGGKGGEIFYRWLKKNNFPPGYRVLCFNCNFGIFKEGVCPHLKKDANFLWPYCNCFLGSYAV